MNDGPLQVLMTIWLGWVDCADGPDKPPVDIDFKRPWPRISFMSGLREALELQNDPQWPANEALHTEDARQYFLRLVRSPPSLLACLP